MKLKAQTELEMQAEEAPCPKTVEELNEYIQSCLDAIKWPKKENGELEHATEESGSAYGKCVYAMSLASVATFHYVAGQVGASGFQASCADLDILRRTRSLKGPFSIVDYTQMLYPQYDVLAKVKEIAESQETKDYLKEKALEQLKDSSLAHRLLLHIGKS